MKKIGFIGAGNMGGAILGGILNSKIIDNDHIIASAKSDRTIERIKRDYNVNVSKDSKEVVEFSDLIVIGVKPEIYDEILEEIKEKKPMAVFVAMGCPRQEKFIVRYMDELPCKIFMGVGGSFDVIAEKVNRAPRWMIDIGMEWAYRVAKEPWRIKRLGSIPKFIWTVTKSRGKN